MNKEQINQIVFRYLEKENTDYAIMLDGPWGCGKTYFVKDTLIPSIQNKVVCASNRKKYQPISISLFGINSTEEIRTNILLQSLQYKKKGIYIKKKINNCVYALAGSILNYYGINERHLFRLLSVLKIPPHMFIIFDDLERSKIKLEDLLGTINFFVEQHHLKVIIVSNENEITNSQEFTKFKEKTIRFSLKYNPEISDILHEILDTQFVNNQNFVQYLKEDRNTTTITSIFNVKSSYNLRTLYFVLDIFEKIYGYLENMNYALEQTDLKAELLYGYLCFTCIYSIEYKSGAKREDLDWMVDWGQTYSSKIFFSIHETGEKSNSFSSAIQIYGDYLKNTITSSVIAEYIQDGNFYESGFKEELQKYEEKYNSLRKTLEGKAFQKMLDWRDIDDTELDSLLRNIESYLANNKYSLVEISVIYARYLMLQYHHIRCYNITDEVFILAIERQKDKHQYDVNIKESLFRWANKDTILDSKYRKIEKLILDINDSSQNALYANDSNELLKILQSGTIDELNTYLIRIDFKLLSVIPYSELWDTLRHSKREMEYCFIQNIIEWTSSELMQDPKRYSTHILSFAEKFILNLKPIFTDKLIEFGLLKYKELGLKIQFLLAKSLLYRICETVNNSQDDNSYLVIDRLILTFDIAPQKKDDSDYASFFMKDILDETTGRVDETKCKSYIDRLEILDGITYR